MMADCIRMILSVSSTTSVVEHLIAKEKYDTDKKGSENRVRVTHHFRDLQQELERISRHVATIKEKLRQEQFGTGPFA